jgi:hypothetical protein
MDIVERLRGKKSAGGYWREKEAAGEIEKLRYALMKVCDSLDDNLPAIITKNIALAALGLPLRGMKEGE